MNNFSSEKLDFLLIYIINIFEIIKSKIPKPSKLDKISTQKIAKGIIEGKYSFSQVNNTVLGVEEDKLIEILDNEAIVGFSIIHFFGHLDYITEDSNQTVTFANKAHFVMDCILFLTSDSYCGNDKEFFLWCLNRSVDDLKKIDFIGLSNGDNEDQVFQVQEWFIKIVCIDIIMQLPELSNLQKKFKGVLTKLFAINNEKLLSFKGLNLDAFLQTFVRSLDLKHKNHYKDNYTDNQIVRIIKYFEMTSDFTSKLYEAISIYNYFDAESIPNSQQFFLKTILEEINNVMSI
jgi:hypothetical protein